MKLQHLAIIFVLIIVPISLVLSTYIDSHISTIQKQTQYTTVLINSTYDAAKAFQLNTYNNRFSTLSDSKIRDIEAAITTFYRTLATNLGMSTYSKKELQATQEIQSYTPAVLCTLYDGYYIYTKYKDTVLEERVATGELDSAYTYGLKPFIAYSCRYKKGNSDFVVNYTLDNTITIIGKVKGKFVTKTGHLISDNIESQIETETLEETLITLDNNGNIIVDNNGNKLISYKYIVYDNQRVYLDKNSDGTPSDPPQYFTYSPRCTKDFVMSNYDDINNCFYDLDQGSAKKYYREAQEFTEWVNSNLGDITPGDAYDSSGKTIKEVEDERNNNGKSPTFSDLWTKRIFNINNSNNPLKSDSVFNQHRMDVIRYSIETNMQAVISNYNEVSRNTSFEFVMPKIEEEEWYNIENNICFVTFLQGFPIGSKTYNNYCVVANNTNQEMVGADSIYIIDNKNEYHKAGCRYLHEGVTNGSLSITGAYASSDFMRRSVSTTGSDANAHTQLEGSDEGDVEYFFPHSGCTACYHCILNMPEKDSSGEYKNDSYTIDEVVAGGTGINSSVRKKYLTALARCRYDLYTVNGYFGSSDD